MSLALFVVGVALAASGWISPAVALAGGLAFGLLRQHPFPAQSRSVSRLLLQAAVVLLGFGMNLREVARAGREGLLYTAISIATALLLGWGLGRLLQVRPGAAYLITCGTAICGGSAIAAIAPVSGAGEEDMAVSLGTVFTLNAVALLLFPAIGWRLHLSQTQFGLWSALAIHDTSSVVGAAARFGPQALAVGTTVKLARALWIVPVALVTSAVVRRQRTAAGQEGKAARIVVPWFIGLFVLTAGLRTLWPAGEGVYRQLNHLGKNSLILVLFLIGTGISRQTLRRVGVRPMVQGIALWVTIAGMSLMAICRDWIAL